MRVLQAVHSYGIDEDPRLNGYIILTDDEQIVTQNISEQGVDVYLEYVFTIPTALEKAIRDGRRIENQGQMYGW